MEKLKKCWRALLTASVIFTILIVFTGCSEKQLTKEMYYEARGGITAVESNTLDLVKDICKEALEDKGIAITDMFVNAYFMDGGNYIKVHVLTYDGQYKIFSVKTKYSGPISSGLLYGEIPPGYEEKTMEYLSTVVPELKGKNIYFY